MQRLCGLIALIVLSGVPEAQTLLVVDLATERAGSPTTESVQPGTYGLRIDNRAPLVSYTVSAVVRTVPIPALPNTALAAMGILSGRTSCPPIDAAIQALGEVFQKTDEKDIKKGVDAAARVLDSTPDCELQKAVLAGLIDQSRYRWPKNILLAAGQELVVTVTRPAIGTAAEQSWVKTFTTGPRGEWRATYGFAAAFTRLGSKSGVFASRNTPFLKTSGSVTTIKERKDRGGADLVPAVLFHFMPSDKESNSLLGGISAGVSFDGTNPTIMGGYGWTYEQNVNLSFGLMARREAVLLAKYDIGDTVAADLTESQLTGMQLRIRPYVVLTFRFSGNPFSSGDGEKGKAKEVEQ